MALLPNSAAFGYLPPSALKVIGVGPAFPWAFSGVGSIKTVTTANGIDKINQSIHLILTTRPGDRIMVPEFGSRLPDLVFEPNDQVLQDLLYIYTVEALRRWERRIRITQVTFPTTDSDIENGIVRIRIVYTVLQTNQQGSFVFPFQRHPMSSGDLTSGQPVPAPNAGSATLVSPFSASF